MSKVKFNVTIRFSIEKIIGYGSYTGVTIVKIVQNDLEKKYFKSEIKSGSSHLKNKYWLSIA